MFVGFAFVGIVERPERNRLFGDGLIIFLDECVSLDIVGRSGLLLMSKHLFFCVCLMVVF